MSTTNPTTYTVTAVLPGEYEKPGEIEAITGVTYYAALSEYERIVAEQEKVIGTHHAEVYAALAEAADAPEGAELTCHFSGSWQIELRADKAPVIA